MNTFIRPRRDRDRLQVYTQ